METVTQEAASTAAVASNVASLAPAVRAVIALKSTETEAHLRSLVAKAQTVSAVADRNGRDLAHSVGMELKRARTAIERAGKEAREDATAFSKAVIAEEKRLAAIVESEEKRVLQLRDEFDAQMEAEKAAKAAAEAARVKRHQDRIATVREALVAAATKDAAGIAELMQAVQDVDNSVHACEEFAEATRQAQDEVVEKLRTMHAAAVEREAEAARLAAERAELERLRAEQAQREAEAAAARAEEERKAREAQEAAARAERERLAAERAAQEAELRARREALEAEERAAAARRAEEERQAAAARAEADRIAREAREAEESRLAAERAERERQEREAAQARQREEDARAAADKRVRDAAHDLLDVVGEFIKCATAAGITADANSDNPLSALMARAVAVHTRATA